MTSRGFFSDSPWIHRLLAQTLITSCLNTHLFFTRVLSGRSGTWWGVGNHISFIFSLCLFFSLSLRAYVCWIISLQGSIFGSTDNCFKLLLQARQISCYSTSRMYVFYSSDESTLTTDNKKMSRMYRYLAITSVMTGKDFLLEVCKRMSLLQSR